MKALEVADMQDVVALWRFPSERPRCGRHPGVNMPTPLRTVPRTVSSWRSKP